ncbi:MAG: hypothetical protein AB1486_05320 [Planctomycetota bacterium]
MDSAAILEFLREADDYIVAKARTGGEDEAFRERLLNDVVAWRPIHRKIEKLHKGEARVFDLVSRAGREPVL